MSFEPLIIEADITIEKETAYLKEKAATFLSLPEEDKRQIDLMYFSAIYASSGENLNHAFFEPSEMVMAEHSIVNKALDVEHVEKEIVGHLYDRVFIDTNGNKLELEDLKKLSKEELNSKDMHIAIAGIIYKHRFPEIAQEVADNKFKVSMETYYQDFDIKIGDLIISRKEAQSLGFEDISSLVGQKRKVMKSGKEIANGTVSRVLRNMSFSGCGLVENPANPPSIILEVATHDDNKLSCNSNNKETKDEVVVIELPDNNLTSTNIDTKEEFSSDMDDEGTCVYYKRRVLNKQDEIIHNDWCSEFETECTSFSRTSADPECLLRTLSFEISKCVEDTIRKRRIERELSALEKVLKRK